ncbi:hypothetical protein CALVIDRAFT_182075 [Calocera viscosa TUFC12733]|uniref:Uncharacterized protein n=1 Tax=Calocera viscosa (strain TUFC12733) TaxID=1330018 RepID=A0A167L0Y3_CALVF|nr:hypothetical protein CALVIDRAFT_182075 [Calocera viscosa TUFC12733]
MFRYRTQNTSQQTYRTNDYIISLTLSPFLTAVPVCWTLMKPFVSYRDSIPDDAADVINTMQCCSRFSYLPEPSERGVNLECSDYRSTEFCGMPSRAVRFASERGKEMR